MRGLEEMRKIIFILWSTLRSRGSKFGTNFKPDNIRFGNNSSRSSRKSAIKIIFIEHYHNKVQISLLGFKHFFAQLNAYSIKLWPAVSWSVIKQKTVKTDPRQKVSVNTPSHLWSSSSLQAAVIWMLLYIYSKKHSVQ